MSNLCQKCLEFAWSSLNEIKRDDKKDWDTQGTQYWLVTQDRPEGDEIPVAEQVKTYPQTVTGLGVAHRKLTKANLLGPEKDKTQTAAEIRATVTQLMSFVFSEDSDPSENTTPCSSTDHREPFRHNSYEVLRDYGHSLRCDLCIRISQALREKDPREEYFAKHDDTTSDDATIQTFCILSSTSDKQDVKTPTNPSKDFCHIDATFLFVRPKPAALISKCTIKLSYNAVLQPSKSQEQRSKARRVCAFGKIRRWIAECKSHHSCDRRLIRDRAGKVDLPRRLVKIDDVDNETRIRLVDPQEAYLEEGQKFLTYATLSHCWGENKDFTKLLNDNLAQYLVEIPLKDLSKTFREAIEVTIALEIKYLWVDALCIIQDSAADWNHEAPRMATVYSEATINLAATGAVGGKDGLFLQDAPLVEEAIFMNWGLADLPSGYWVPLSSEEDWMYQYELFINRAGLNRRGWVFQERALSPRTVHFARDQIWWRCHENLFNEYGVRHFIIETDWTTVLDPSEGSHWHDLVTSYSACALSEESDKFVAFSGIAQAYAKFCNFQSRDYHAGLWFPTIRNDLLWRRVSSEPAQTPSKVLNSLPTWSWASVKGQVLFPSIGIDHVDVWNPMFTEISVSEGGGITFNPIYSPSKSRRGPDIDHLEQGLLTFNANLIQFSSFDQNYGARSTLSVSNTEYVMAGSNILTDLNNTRGISTTFQLSLDDAVSEGNKTPFTGIFVPMLERNLVESDGEDRIECIDCWGLVISKVEGHRGTFRRVGVLVISFPQNESALPAWMTDHGGFDTDDHCIKNPDGSYAVTII